MRILHVIHDFLPRHRAGSEIYAHLLARQQARDHHVEVLSAEYDASRVHGSYSCRAHEGVLVTEVVNNWRFGRFQDTYSPPDLNRVLCRILDESTPDILHIHNLLNLSLDLPRLASERGIPSVATLHDYTLVCASGGQRFHLTERRVCQDIQPEVCARCFEHSPFHQQMGVARLAWGGRFPAALVRAGERLRRRAPRAFEHAVKRLAPPAGQLSASDIEQRLAAARRVFDEVALFVAPSQALAEEYIRLGIPPERIRTSRYGNALLHPLPRRQFRVLRVGFVGTLAWHKGVHVVIEALRKLPAERVRLRVFGDLAVAPAYARELQAAAAGLPVAFEGGFDQERVAEVYAGIDVLVVPSLWLENSPFVVREAFMAKVPVIASAIGGLSGEVRHGVDGLLVEPGSSERWGEALERALKPGALAKWVRGIRPVKPIEEDAAEWEAVYAHQVHVARQRALSAS